MMERFHRLALREQIILGMGGALAVIIVTWGLVWKPLQNSVGELRESVGDRSRIMVDLRRAAGLKSATADPGSAANSQNLAVLVDATARPLGLAESLPLSRQEGNDMRVTVREAQFTLIIDWLIGLEREHGVRARVVNLQRTARPGLVSGQILLSRS
jgi:type II secretory pathway component PulM